EYRKAIEGFRALAREQPDPEYREALADTYNWLGETVRPEAARAADAAAAYEEALPIQTALVAAYPGKPDYRQALARAYGRRGLLRGSTADPATTQYKAAEADFRE